MGSNFFLDNNYNKKQIDSINKIKAKADNASGGNTVEGDSKSIFDEIKSYKNNNKTTTNNSDLFTYIEKTMGMENFLNLIDANNDGNIADDEIQNLIKYDKNDALTSKDIDAFKNDIKNVKEAKTTGTKGTVNTEYTYEDKNGKLVKKSATAKDSASGTVIKEFTYDDNGNVKTKVNKLNNRTTEYVYKKGSDGKWVRSSAVVKSTSTGEITAEVKYNDKGKRETYDDKIAKTITSYNYDTNGKLTGNEVTVTGTNIVKSKSTYDDNGFEKDRIEYFSVTGNTKTPHFLTFEYDEYGRKCKVTQYKGESASGEPVAEYTYQYENTYTRKPKTRTNTKTNEIKEYTYDKNNELTDITFRDKDGNVLATCKCNKDGTYESITKGDETTFFTYENGGIIQKSEKYKNTDLDEKGKPKKGAIPEETTKYENGVRTETTTKDGDTTTFDKDGNKTMTEKKNGDKTFYEGGQVKVEIQGDKAYVYTNNSDGTKVKTTYAASDINDKGKLKSGARPKGSVTVDKSGKEIKEDSKTDEKSNDDSKTDKSNETEDTSGNTDTSPADSLKEAGKKVAALAKSLLKKGAKYFGESGSKWCTEFADWVLNHSGQNLAGWFKSDKKSSWSEVEHDGKNARIKSKDVMPGDLVVINDNHTAIVVSVNGDGSFVTVDGGGGGVKQRTRKNISSGSYKFYRALS